MYLSKVFDPKRLRAFTTFITPVELLVAFSAGSDWFPQPANQPPTCACHMTSQLPFPISVSRNFNARGDVCVVKAVFCSLLTTLDIGLSELVSVLFRELGGIWDTPVFIASETPEAPVSALY